MDDYSYIATVGEGAYGQVWKCKQISTGGIVAVKGFKEAHEDPEIMRLALREVRILKAISHPNCVKLLQGFRSTTGRVYFVFEYVPSNALSLLHDTRDKGVPSAVLKRLAWGLLQAVTYLHDSKIIHRDIKPANVLLTTDQQVKLCDFGFARFMDCGAKDAQHLTSYMVTRWYRAPEVLAGDNYGPASDIWSLGVTLAELAAGQPLFPGKSSLDQLWLIMRCLGPLTHGQRQCCIADPRLRGLAVPRQHKTLRQRLQGLEEPLMQLIEACLQVDPSKRKTAKELLQLPCFWNMPMVDEGKALHQEWPACPATPPMPDPRLPQTAPVVAATGSAAVSPDQPAATPMPATPAAPGLPHFVAAAAAIIHANLPAVTPFSEEVQQPKQQQHVQDHVKAAEAGRVAAAAAPAGVMSGDSNDIRHRYSTCSASAPVLEQAVPEPSPAAAAGAATATMPGAVAAATAAVAAGCKRVYRMVDDENPGAQALPAALTSPPCLQLPDTASEDAADGIYATTATLDESTVTHGSMPRDIGIADIDSQAPLQLMYTPAGTPFVSLIHATADERLPHRRPEFMDSQDAYPPVDPRLYDSGPCSAASFASNFRGLISMGNSETGAMPPGQLVTQWSSAWSSSGAAGLKAAQIPPRAATTQGYITLPNTAAGQAEGQHVPSTTTAGNLPTSQVLKAAWPATAESGSGSRVQRSMSALLPRSSASAASLQSTGSASGMMRASVVGPSRLRGAAAAIGGCSETRPLEARADAACRGSAEIARHMAVQAVAADLCSGQLSVAQPAHSSVQAAALRSRGGPEAARRHCATGITTAESEREQAGVTVGVPVPGAHYGMHAPNQQLSIAHSRSAMAAECRSRSSLGSLAEGAEGAASHGAAVPPHAAAKAASAGSGGGSPLTVARSPSAETARRTDGFTTRLRVSAGAAKDRRQGLMQRIVQRLQGLMRVSCMAGPDPGVPLEQLEEVCAR